MNFNISDEDRIQLDKMLQENDVEDTTHKIRELKHSVKIEEGLRLIEGMKKEYPRIYKTNYERFEQMVQSRGGSWLWTYYTNIYNKLMKNQIDPSILYSMVQVLRKIENAEIDQHEGSVAVGRILKQIYIDSIVEKETKQTSHKTHKKMKKMKQISWSEYKEQVMKQNHGEN